METPLEAIERLRRDRPECTNEKLSYAGRLDPMAEGLLLVLIGEENKDRERYLGLDKEYEVDILWGVSTDTGDVLGVPLWRTRQLSPGEREARAVLESFVGLQRQQYPAFSSRTVEGKPLWMWAREGRLNEVGRPARVVEIYEIERLKDYTKEARELRNEIVSDISRVKGDFRQSEIVSAWKNKLAESADREGVIHFTRIHVSCSSGMYMRQLVSDVGDELGVPALAYRIQRTRVGEFIM